MAKNMSEIKEWFGQLADQVEEAGDVLSVQMRQLREGIGAGRLDGGPISQITAALGSAGLRSTPLDYVQQTYVLIYRAGTPIAAIIDAAVAPNDSSAAVALVEAVSAYNPGEADPRDDELTKLREAMEQVQAIVSEFE